MRKEMICVFPYELWMDRCGNPCDGPKNDDIVTVIEEVHCANGEVGLVLEEWLHLNDDPEGFNSKWFVPAPGIAEIEAVLNQETICV